MRILSFITTITLLAGAASPVLAATTPCEEMLKTVRAAQASAKLSDADAKAVADLVAKGIDRCNADDDKRADVFFSDALKRMGQ